MKNKQPKKNKAATEAELQDSRNLLNPFAEQDERDGPDLLDDEDERNSFLDMDEDDEEEEKEEYEDFSDDFGGEDW